MFPPLSLLLSIFVIYPKKKKKMTENDFFFEKFGYAWGTHAEVSQEYEYPKSIWYGYPCFIAGYALHQKCQLKNLRTRCGNLSLEFVV
jgi:hypothetical protein